MASWFRGFNEPALGEGKHGGNLYGLEQRANSATMKMGILLERDVLKITVWPTTAVVNQSYGDCHECILLDRSVQLETRKGESDQIK